jgi:hypothetical protein
LNFWRKNIVIKLLAPQSVVCKNKKIKPKLSDMEETDEITLHYAMLQYLFDNKKLGSSCFNSVWEVFLTINREYENLTPTELKMMFWRVIAPNLKNYQLLTNVQLKYFDDLFLNINDEDMIALLEQNEPDERDFMYWKSRDKFLMENQSDQQLQQENDHTIVEKSNILYEEPTRGAAEDIDNEKKVHILADNDEVIEINSFVELFNLFLISNQERDGGITNLSEDEIRRRLRDPETLSCADDLAKVPSVKKYFDQNESFKRDFSSQGYFEEPISEIMSPERSERSVLARMRSDSSLEIPDLQSNASRSTTNLRTLPTNITTRSQTHLRRLSRSEMLLRTSSSAPERRQKFAKQEQQSKSQNQSTVINQRMEKFIQRLKTKRNL